MCVWATASTFGAPGVCNDATIFVIFFVDVRATMANGYAWWYTINSGALFPDSHRLDDTPTGIAR